MDHLDVKILRWLLQGQTDLPLDPDFRKSYRAIARDLGLDEGMVRYRVKRFGETGFIPDWHLMANPRLWGGGHAIIWIDVPLSVPRRELFERLKLVPGVFYLTRFFGTVVEAYLAYEDEQSVRARAELLGKISDAKSVKFARWPFPVCGVALSTLDWRLVRSLSESPRRPYIAIAKELGVSSRTVKRRLLRLSRGGAVFAYPDFNLGALSGSVMASLFVTCQQSRMAEIDRTLSAKLDPYLWHAFHMLSFGPSDVVPCNYNLLLPNITVAQELVRKAQELAGVREARAELVEEIVVLSSTLEGMTRRMAELLSVGVG